MIWGHVKRVFSSHILDTQMLFLSLDWPYHKQFKLQTILSGAPDLQRLTGLEFVLLALTGIWSSPWGKGQSTVTLRTHVPSQTNNREVIQLLLLSYLMPIGIGLFIKLLWLLLNSFQTSANQMQIFHKRGVYHMWNIGRSCIGFEQVLLSFSDKGALQKAANPEVLSASSELSREGWQSPSLNGHLF